MYEKNVARIRVRGGGHTALALTELNAYVTQHIVPRATDIIYASSPVFTRLESQNREPFTGNSLVQRTVNVGELAGDFMNKGDAVNIDFVVTDAAITAAMKVAWVNITLLAMRYAEGVGRN